MPKIYLSPSTQEGNYYINGGSEEEFMNKIADRMEPYLWASGIEFVRNTPDMTAASSIRQSNEGNYDLHFGLHSNAAAPPYEGKAQGSIVFYYPSSEKGKKWAEITANNLRSIYPEPSKVRAEATTLIGEVRLTRAPSVFVELAFHDNLEDAVWIKNNLDSSARNLVLSITEFFDLPFLSPIPPRKAVVDVTWGYLNFRDKPSAQGNIVGHIVDGTELTIINQWQDWYLVDVQGNIGYINQDYVTIVTD